MTLEAEPVSPGEALSGKSGKLLLLSLIYRSRGCYLLSEIKLYTNIGARWSKYCECYELKIKPERCQRKTISFRHDDLTLITPHRQTKQQSAAKTIE